MVETPKRTLTAPFWPITPRNPEGMPRWANDITFALSAAFGQLITRIEDVTDAGSTERLGLLTPIGSRKFYYDQGSTDLYFDTPDAEWARVGSADMTSGYFATKEPTGFLDKSETTLSWDDGTRTLTLTLVGSDATVYHNGRLITLTTNLSKQITDVDGQHYIFIDSDGELQSSTALYSQEFIRDEIAVAEVYWNSTDSEATIVADERHGLMPWQVHLWLHLFQGAQRRSGLGLGSILADDTGASNTHAEMSVSSGVILDEDNEITIGSSVAPAKIPVLAKRGVSAEWYIAGYSNAPLVLNGSSIPYYNSVGGGGWSLTAVTNTKFTLVHIFATNDIRYGYIAVMGEAEYNNIIDARDGANNEISQITTAGLPMDEFVAVGTVIYQINTAYTNSYNARIVSTTTGDDYVSWLSGAPYNAATGPSSHASLVDRDLPDQHPADAISVDITGFSGILSGTDTDVQTALDTIDAHTHSYLPLTGGELSGDLTLANGVALRGKDTGGTAYDMIELRSDNILQIGKAKDVRIGDYDGGSYVWVHYSDGDIYMAGGNLTLSTGNIDASAGYIDADQGVRAPVLEGEYQETITNNSPANFFRWYGSVAGDSMSYEVIFNMRVTYSVIGTTYYWTRGGRVRGTLLWTGSGYGYGITSGTADPPTEWYGAGIARSATGGTHSPTMNEYAGLSAGPTTYIGPYYGVNLTTGTYISGKIDFVVVSTNYKHGNYLNWF